MKVILSVPDEGFSRNVPNEGYSRNVPDEGYSRHVPGEGYSSNVPDEGYSSNVPGEGYSSNVPGEGYSRNVSCVLTLISMFLYFIYILKWQSNNLIIANEQRCDDFNCFVFTTNNIFFFGHLYL